MNDLPTVRAASGEYLPALLVTERAMRPASPNRECFYCRQPIGTPHKDDCVCVNRKATIRVTFEYEIDVPASWDKAMVEFHRNESSWCADNVLDELEALSGDDSCLCDRARTECLGISGASFVKEA